MLQQLPQLLQQPSVETAAFTGVTTQAFMAESADRTFIARTDDAQTDSDDDACMEAEPFLHPKIFA